VALWRNQACAAETQRNIQLTTVLSDAAGKTSQKILHASVQENAKYLQGNRPE
jgi:hypothetical protein